MGILEVLTGPQEPQRVVEHVRRLVGHVSTFRSFMTYLSREISVLRRQVKGELQIEGLFYPTHSPDVVELRVTVLHRTPKGRISHACVIQFHLQCQQGHITEILSSTILPPEEG